MNKRLYLIVALILIISLPFINASIPSLNNQKAGTCISLPQTCSNCTFVNITTIQYPNSTIQIINANMTQIATHSFSYTYCLPNLLGTYYVNTFSDDSTPNAQYEVPVTSSGLNGMMFFYILIFSLAIIFLIVSIMVNEELFVYLSGLLFLVGGIIIMIYGLDIISEWFTRAISYISIGLGLLFVIGAYIFNSYSGRKDDEYD